MLKKQLYFAIAIAVLFTLGNVQAAGAEQVNNVYVRNLSLTTSTLSEGETVEGTFDLINTNTSPAPGVSYVIVLSSYNAVGNPIDSYDDKMSQPIDLGPQETKSVSFSYQLPAGVTGNDLGIRVRAVSETGFKMGWGDALITVAGSPRALMQVSKAGVTVNGTSYAPEAGPTVYTSDTATYSTTLSNPTTAAITLNPIVSIFRNDVSGTLERTINAAAITIPSKKTSSVSISLPQDLAPGVYSARVEFRDANNYNRAPLSTFRFIIAGDIVNITEIHADKTSVATGGTVAVTVAYTGTPADISANPGLHEVGKADLTVQLYNEQGELIGEGATTPSFGAKGEETVNVTLNKTAVTISAAAQVSKNGTVLAHLTRALPVTVTQSSTSLSQTTIIGLGMVIVIILAIGALFAFRGRRMNTFTSFILIFGAALAFSFVSAGKAEASFTVTNSYNVPADRSTDWVPQVFINAPSGTMSPGEQFYVTGSASVQACENQPSNIGYLLKYENFNGGQWKNMGTSTNANPDYAHAFYSYSDTFTCGGSSCTNNSPGQKFVAPNAPGTYRVYLRVFNDPYYLSRTTTGKTNAGYGWVEGYVQFTVAALPAPTLSLKVNNASSITVPQNSSATLSWTTTNLSQGDTCSADTVPDDWAGNRPISDSIPLGPFSKVRTYSYTLVCTRTSDGAKTNSSTATVTVQEPPPVPVPAPTVTLNINGKKSASISVGSSAQLSWSSSNLSGGDVCSASGDWNGNKAQSGSASTGALLNKTYTYTLKCTRASDGKSATDSVTASTVTTPPPPKAPAPQVTLKINNKDSVTVNKGTVATLSWTTVNADNTCVATGASDWSGVKGTNGTAPVTVNGPTTYNITCTNKDKQSVSDSVTASITAPPGAPGVNITANGSDGPLSVPPGTNVTLRWIMSGGPATTCTASNSWSGTKSAQGSTEDTSVAQNGVYTIQCSGPGGSTTDSVAVNIDNNPTNGGGNLSASCAGNPSSPKTGASVTWTATATGGSGGYTYSWSGAVTGSGQSVTVSKGYSETGPQNATVSVTDSNGKSVNSPVCSIVVGSPDATLTLDCRPTVVNNTNKTIANPVNGQAVAPGAIVDPTDRAAVGQQVTWKSEVSGGSGVYSYQWSDGSTAENPNPADALNSMSANAQKNYSSIGQKLAKITVTDADGQSASKTCGTSPTFNVLINPNWGQF